MGRMGWRKNREVSGQGRGKQEVEWERLGLDLGGTSMHQILTPYLSLNILQFLQIFRLVQRLVPLG